MNDVPLSTDHLDKIPKADEPDAHGQAALLLVESLIHTLVHRGVVTNVDSVNTITTAMEVKVEVAALTGESRGRMQQSLDLLDRMRVSFEADD